MHPVIGGRSAVVCVVLLSLVSPVAAGAPRWTYASSPHFEVYTTSGDSGARAALEYFERIHAFFAGFVDIALDTPNKTRLVVFSGAREFAPYRPTDEAVAYYLPGDDRDHIVMRALDRNAYPVIVHEYAHVALRRAGDTYPAWLEEGLAEFFSTMAPEGNRMSLGRVSKPRLDYLKHRREPLLDLSRLFEVDQASPEYTQHAQMFYAQSWALVHMLLTTEGYRAKAPDFLAQVRGGRSSARAFETIYGKAPSAVRTDLHNHYGNGRFNPFSVDYRDSTPTIRPATRAVPAFESAFVTAALLAEMPDGADRARAAYAELTLARPDDLPLAEARAELEVRDGSRAAAVGLLQRAIELGSRSARTYRYAAALAATDVDREALLRTALSLAPDDVGFRIGYAATAARLGRPTVVLATLAGMIDVPPERAFTYFMLQATAHAHLDQLAPAVAAARRASDVARNGENRSHADDFIRNTTALAAQRAEWERVESEYAAARAEAASRAIDVVPASPQRARTWDPHGTEWNNFGAAETIVDGRLTHLQCGNPRPIAEIRVGAATVRLRIDNPRLIKVEGKGAPTIDLPCGPQNTRLRVGYNASPDASTTTSGVIRLLDYR